MQYDQTFYAQLCSDNRARHVRLMCDGSDLTIRATSLDLSDQTQQFETDLYLDQQDREALAAALRPVKFEPRLHWSELVAMGAVAGLLVGFVSGALL